jgi:hypothetical protein
MACGQAPAGQSVSATAQSDAAVKIQYRSAARRALGEESQVLLSGDLAHNGHIQLLIVNRLPKSPGDPASAVVISRGAILEREAESWREVFLADDHLKNENGFLQGAPEGSVSGWRLQCNPGKGGLTMFLTPLRQPSGPDSPAVEVRWNPRAQRYQAFDRRTGSFLGEIPTAQGIPSFLMKR